MEEIGLRELRLKLGPTLERVAGGRTMVVTNTNRPRAVLLPVDEYERLRELSVEEEEQDLDAFFEAEGLNEGA